MKILLRIFLLLPVTSPTLGPNILLSTLYSNILSLCETSFTPIKIW